VKVSEHGKTGHECILIRAHARKRRQCPMASHAVPHTCWMRRDSKTSCPIRQLGSMGADLVLAKGPSTELPTN
jgi:hypothetical protein